MKAEGRGRIWKLQRRGGGGGLGRGRFFGLSLRHGGMRPPVSGTEADLGLAERLKSTRRWEILVEA